MFEYDRFAVEKKEYIFSYAPDFANCKEETEKPTGAIMLDFVGERQKPAESPCTLAETACENNANPLFSPRETSEIAQDDAPAIVTPDGIENGEICHESRQSKGHVSNFANARLY